MQFKNFWVGVVLRIQSGAPITKTYEKIILISIITDWEYRDQELDIAHNVTSMWRSQQLFESHFGSSLSSWRWHFLFQPEFVITMSITFCRFDHSKKNHDIVTNQVLVTKMSLLQLRTWRWHRFCFSQIFYDIDNDILQANYGHNNSTSAMAKAFAHVCEMYALSIFCFAIQENYLIFQ